MQAIFIATLVAAAGSALPAAAQSPPPVPGQDFPTATRVEYVMSCMAAHSGVPLILEKCSCSFDEMARRVSYVRYLRAETIQRMRRAQGERSVIFKTSPDLKRIADELREAQIEAALICFPPQSAAQDQKSEIK